MTKQEMTLPVHARVHVGIAALIAAAALVSTISSAVAKPAESDFWSDIVDPGRKEFMLAVDRGMKLLKRARKVGAGTLRQRLYAEALAEFKVANRASPRNVKGWYFTAQTHYDLDHMKECIAAFSKVRKLDSKAMAYEVAFSLGIAYSKVGAFEKAVTEYDRAEQVLPDTNIYRGRRATLLGNAAEALMALGRLDEAIQRYSRAVVLRPSLSRSRNSSLSIRWGLAVAYDRDEQISKAVSHAQLALRNDPKMVELTSENVFFIPAGDVHYYFALGNEVQGNAEEARKHWKLFLSKLPGSQWADRARAHLAQLGVSTRRQPRRARLAPVPGTRTDQQEIVNKDRRSFHYKVQHYAYRFRKCYAQALKKRPGLTGSLRVSFLVEPNGRASKGRVVRSTMRNARLHRCVLDVLKGIYFGRPSSKKPVKVDHPFEFKI